MVSEQDETELCVDQVMVSNSTFYTEDQLKESLRIQILMGIKKQMFHIKFETYYSSAELVYFQNQVESRLDGYKFFIMAASNLATDFTQNIINEILNWRP